MSLWDFMRDQLANNDMMAAAVVAAPMTALVFSAKNLPVAIFKMLKRSATMEISFNSDMADYLAVQQFVMGNIVSEGWTRSYLYQAEERWDRDAGETVAEHKGLSAGYGVHLGSYRGTPVLVNRHTVEGQQTDKFKERLCLTFVTRRRSIVQAFADDLRESCGLDCGEKLVNLFINSADWWRRAGKLPMRSLSTVITRDGIGTRLLQHLREFEGRRDWCREKGLPYHTGVLLTGPPGTGKSSLIHAIASEMGRTIHYLNLGSVSSDQQLTDLVASGRNWNRAILVIEDADAANAMVSRAPVQAAPQATAGPDAPESAKPVTLSALLNVLDGLLTPDGLIVIATSNHPEKLDPALIRPGRFDLHLNLGDLGWPEFEQMAALFDMDASDHLELKAAFKPTSGATLRSLLLEGGIEAVVRHFGALPNAA